MILATKESVLELMETQGLVDTDEYSLVKDCMLDFSKGFLDDSDNRIICKNNYTDIMESYLKHGRCTVGDDYELIADGYLQELINVRQCVEELMDYITDTKRINRDKIYSKLREMYNEIDY